MDINEISRLFASHGGKKRAESMTAAQRSDQARRAVEARWAKRRAGLAAVEEKRAKRAAARKNRKAA
jgi:hypothetical protein